MAQAVSKDGFVVSGCHTLLWGPGESIPPPGGMVSGLLVWWSLAI